MTAGGDAHSLAELIVQTFVDRALFQNEPISGQIRGLVLSKCQHLDWDNWVCQAPLHFWKIEASVVLFFPNLPPLRLHVHLIPVSAERDTLAGRRWPTSNYLPILPLWTSLIISCFSQLPQDGVRFQKQGEMITVQKVLNAQLPDDGCLLR